MNGFNTYIKENYDRIIGWGTSNYFQMIYPQLNIKLEYLIDSDSSKHGQILEGIPILSKDMLRYEDPSKTLIIIFSSFYDEITKAIRTYGEFYTISGMDFIKLQDYLNYSNPSILEDDEKDKGIVISISRNNFALYIGGTSKFIREQMEIINMMNYINIHMFWKSYNIKKYQGDLITIVKDGIELGIYKLEDIFRELKNIRSLIIHNLIGMDLEVADNIIGHIKQGIPILYYIHDFSSICNSIKLLYNDREFCRAYENNWERCLTCIHKEERERIYSYHSKLFTKKNIRIITPSENTRRIISKAFDIAKEKITVIGHQKFDLTPKKDIKINEKIRIAYVGYKDTIKGWEIFKNIVKDFKEDYEFYCLGMSDEVLDGVKYVDVSFIEDGSDAMINTIINYNIDVSLLWSLCPETYSYTYFESFAGGAFVITNELSGNIADQVRKNKNGIVLKSYNELYDLLNNVQNLHNLIHNNKTIIKNIQPNEEFIDFIKNA